MNLLSEYTRKQLNFIGVGTIILNLIVFAILHIVLSRAYVIGIVAVVTFGIIAAGIIGAAIYMSIAEKGSKLAQYYVALTAGIFLWGLLGEIPEHYYYFNLSSWRLMPLLFTAVGVYFLAVIKYKIRDGITIMFTMFMIIWFWHNLMVTQFHMLGENHWTTYLSAAVCVIIGGIFSVKMLKSENLWITIAFSIVSIIHFWNIVEYIQAWNGGHGDHSH